MFRSVILQYLIISLRTGALFSLVLISALL
nr:MAG TPA: hypothetical protein [Caudoviricetes sp.]